MLSWNILSEVQVPIAILGAEIDQYSPLELLKQFEEILATKSEVCIYVCINNGLFSETKPYEFSC